MRLAWHASPRLGESAPISAASNDVSGRRGARLGVPPRGGSLAFQTQRGRPRGGGGRAGTRDKRRYGIEAMSPVSTSAR
ncbi:MAG: hypothetical protein AAF845_13780 [Bacteroidota bacterium]